MYKKPGILAKRFALSTHTLANWFEKGHITGIKVGGKRRRYDVASVERYVGETNTPEQHDKRVNLIYARVSSSAQKEDLKRQVRALKQAYRNHTVYKDVGSGLNYKRKQFSRLLDLVLQGAVRQVVVAHRDRLGRFAVDLCEKIFSSSNTELIVAETSPFHSEHELRDDLLASVTYFVAQNNGRRSAEHRRKRRRVETPSEEAQPSTSSGTTQHGH